MMNNIEILRKTTTISICLNDWNKFKQVFWSDKVYNFHVIQKKIKGNKIEFEIRSMRVNEFCDILDKNNIKWILEQ